MIRVFSHTATPWRALPKRRASTEMFTRLTGPVSAESRPRTDTHLPYAVLVQRRWRSTLRGRVARGGPFGVSVGAAAAAPGATSFRAAWHSVLGWLPVKNLGAVSEGLYAGARWMCAGLSMHRARRGPASFCVVSESLWWQNVKNKKIKNKWTDCSRLWEQGERSLCAGMLRVCSWSLRMYLCAHVNALPSDALSRNSAGSVLPSKTIGHFVNALRLTRNLEFLCSSWLSFIWPICLKLRFLHKLELCIS